METSKANPREIWRFLRESSGGWGLALFLICVLSGIILAIPYDVTQAYDSVSILMLTNPPASLFRNLHYWSAQFFLVITLIHFLDYFLLGQETKLRFGVWARLALSVPGLFFVMLSGFILKGDAESMQAFRILDAMFCALPGIGKAASGFFLGTENDLQIVYVHHIATATVFLLIVILEHARRIWASWTSWLISLLFLTIIGFFFQAPLHDNFNPIVKGPWYFLGLQEILHWMASGAWVWVMGGVLFFLLLLIPTISCTYRYWIKKSLVVLGIIYFLLCFFAYFFRAEAWTFRLPWEGNEFGVSYFPTPWAASGWSGMGGYDFQFAKLGNGRFESCMACHYEMSGFSPSHDPKAIGCYVCHRGNPLSINKEIAHKGMYLVPGNLENARISCGVAGCHPAITERVSRSIMSTLSGIVSIDRYVFGESHTLDALNHISQLGQSAADNHLRDLCASCHLGNKKTQTGPFTESQTGGGCNACHLSYDEIASKAFFTRQNHSGKDTLLPLVHPRLDLKISNNRCFACHSRSGRISTCYEGWHETSLTAEEAQQNPALRTLEDKRVFTFVSPDIHYSKGMQCIDCHISWELMGDGQLYAHKEEQTRVKCTDCHFNGPASVRWASQVDDDARRILNLQVIDSSKSNPLKVQHGGYTLWNTGIDKQGQGTLFGKTNARSYKLRPPGKNCQEGTVHKNLSCVACHTAWTPTCLGCHNTYDPKAVGFDLLAQKEVKGEWSEHIGLFLADVPTLGVSLKPSGKEEFVSCAPGMILSIDKGSYRGRAGKDIIFHRLFSPVNPHTIQTKGLSCVNCHQNPLVLGYGRGELSYETKKDKGRWAFKPKFALRQEDGLPEDAWIGFLDGRKGGATRHTLRPLNIEEQQRMLTVGACLHCHKPESSVMMASLKSYDTLLKSLSKHCILPAFDEKVKRDR